MTPLDHALYYAARGWRVIPIEPGQRHPRINGWQNIANADEARIRKYWTLNPTHGIGIVTGAETGLFVVDIDPRDGGDDSLRALEQHHGPLPDTVEALTGRDGRHLYFAWPDTGDIRNSAGQLGAGIDVRGTGGFVVAPPTIHAISGKAYTWEIEHDPFDGLVPAAAPVWLLDLIQRPLAAAQPQRVQRDRGKTGELPGDIWEASTTWADELTKVGATLHSTHHDAAGDYYELWTRPGKDRGDGASASLYYRGSDVLKVFTSNWPGLQAEETYTLWGFHVQLEHGGDHATAAREQRRAMNAANMPADMPAAPSSKELESKQLSSSPTDIVWNGRQLDDVTATATSALVAHNTPPALFVRAGQLARLRQDEDERPLIEGLRNDHVRLALSDAANWWRANKDGERTATSPPLDVCSSVLARGQWDLPALAGVVELPVLRPDGTFVVEHGYDAATRLFHWHRGAEYPPVPDTPTADELAAAVALVDDMLCDFPWDSTADRANAWGLLLTPLVRPLVGQVPMALVDAPEPGTGKGLLVQAAAIVTIGRAAALMAWPASDEELEKKVTAALMAGNTMLIFDNVEGVIKSPTLAAVLTADSWQGRVLGRSEMVTVPNRGTWAATGNNLDVGGDLARRCYRIRLDARQAQPWKRTGFRHPDLVGWVAENRGAILHALCTIVRSWWIAGRRPADELAAMGGYSSWVRTIGGILAHAGVTDFLANLAEFHADADREAQAWEAFLVAWADVYEEQPVTVAELIAKMSDSQWGFRLHDVLPEDLSGYWGTAGFSRRLSLALRKRTGRHYGADGLHLVEMPRDRRNVAVYSVTNRTMELFDQLPHSREARECEPTDANSRANSRANDDSLTCDNTTERGSAGVAGVNRLLTDDEAAEKVEVAAAGQTPATPNSRAADGTRILRGPGRPATDETDW